MELEDLVYSYPDINDPNFQAKISLKLEFLELASEIKEATPERGQAYRHQQFMRRIMLVIDRILVVDETGTGKSCGFFQSADQFSPEFIERFKPPAEISALAKALVDFVEIYVKPLRTHIEKVIFLSSGKTLTENMKRQIVCVCSYKYETERIKKAEDKSQQRNLVTRDLRPFYDFHTYRKFAKSIMDSSSITRNEAGAIVSIRIPERLIKEYSNTMFVLEEAHNLRTQVGQVEQQLQEELELSGVDDQEDRIKLSKKAEVYITYATLFNQIRQSKILALTATPMVDGEDEIIGLMNLLLPSGKKMPVKPIAEYADDELASYFNGYVSYVRALDSGAEIEYQGVDLYTESGQKLETKVYPLRMKPFQERYYIQSTELTTSKITAARSGEKQAGSFVAPNGAYRFVLMKEFFDILPAVTQITVEGKIKVIRPRIVKPKASFKQQLKVTNTTFPTLSDMTVKYECIFQIAQASLAEAGNGYAFFEFVGDGADMAGNIFDANGWERFDGRTSMFRYTSGIAASSYCGSEDFEREVILKPAPRYAIFTSTVDPFYILEALNSKENADGKYLKWILASPVSALGISFKNTTTIVLANGAWNMASNYQRISRAIRAGGWDYLLELIKEKLIAEGQDASDPKVNVKIYQLATYTAEAYNHFQATDKFMAPPLKKDGVTTRGPEMYSIDAANYAEAERKDHPIQRVMKVMKSSSINCMIHRIRNQRSTDMPGSAACHYLGDCIYGCLDDDFLLEKARESLPPGIPSGPAALDQFIHQSVDLDSYLVLYSEQIVDQIIGLATSLFSIRSEFTVQNLVNLVADLLATDPKYNQELGMYIGTDRIPIYAAKLVDLAIEKIISEQSPIVNRFGFTNYVVEDRSLLKLAADLPTVIASRFHDIPLKGYASKLIANETFNTVEYGNMIRTAGPSVVDQFTEISSLMAVETTAGAKFNTVLKYLNTLDHQVQNDILEQAFIECEGQESLVRGNACDFILYRYRSFILRLPEPTVLIEEAETKRSLTVGKRITINTANVNNLIDPSFISESGAKEVIVNTYRGQGVSEKTGKTAVTTRFNTIPTFYNPKFLRLYDSAIESWRDMSQQELWAYNRVIQAYRLRILYNLDALGRFTAIHTYSDGITSIKDRDKAVGKAIQENSKRMSKGMSCDSYPIPWLVYIAANLGSDFLDVTSVSSDDDFLRREIKRLWANKLKGKVALVRAIDTDMTIFELQFMYKFIEQYPNDRGMKPILCKEITNEAVKTGRILYI